jgi:hypothetical protein
MAHISYRFVETKFRTSRERVVIIQHRFKPIPILLSIIICVPLATASFITIHEAPIRTSIETNYEHEALLMTIDNINQTEAAMATVAINPLPDTARPESPSEEKARIEREQAQRHIETVQRQTVKEANESAGKITSNPANKVTVIGDSVTLGAASAIKKATGAYVDAKVSRSMYAGIDVINSYINSGRLGEYLVIALATNVHDSSYSSLDKILKNMPSGHRVILVTGRGYNYMKPFANYIREEAQKYDFVTVADWEQAIKGKESLLAADGIHLGSTAAKIYADTIAAAINEAANKPTS